MVVISPPPGPADADLVATALAYAARGWPVFPLHTPDAHGHCSCRDADCDDVGKHPRTRHGFKDASTDPMVITGWWRTFPNANIGIRTGAESGLVVLDVDAAKGGKESLARLEATHGSFLSTLTVETGGGGLHLYLAHPGGRVRNSEGKLGAGLDVRGDGGFVVAPPSVHRSGQRYRWTPGSSEMAQPAALPPWILAGTARPVRSNVQPSDEARIPEGQRNRTLTSIAGKLRRDGLSEAAMRAALSVTNDERCDPPLDEREVAKIAKSVARYPVEPSGVSALREAPAHEIIPAQKRGTHLQETLSAVIAMIENPHLKSEAVIALRIITLLEHRHAEAPTPDGFYRISDNDLADAWNRDKPIRSRSTITRAKKRLGDWGLFEFTNLPGSRVEDSLHPDTGEVTSHRRQIEETWIRRDRPMLEKLKQLAAFVDPQPKVRGKARATTRSNKVKVPRADEVLAASVEHADAQVLGTSVRFPMRHSDADIYVPPTGGGSFMHQTDALGTSPLPPLQDIDPVIESVPQ